MWSPSVRKDGRVRLLANMLNSWYKSIAVVGDRRHPKQKATHFHYKVDAKDVCQFTFVECWATSFATIRRARAMVTNFRLKGVDINC